MSKSTTLIVFLACIAQAQALVTIRHSNNTENLDIIAYNGLPWPFEQPSVFTELTEEHHAMVPLIPVDVAIEGEYDPCDESTFNEHSMDSALEDWYVRANGTYWNATDDEVPFNERPWIAYLDRIKIPLACARDQLHWYYSPFMVLSAQKLGASGVITDNIPGPQLSSVTLPAGVDIGAKTVHGTTITIPCLILATREDDSVALLAVPGSLSAATLMEEDPNEFDVLWQRFGVYHCISLLFSFSFVVLAFYIARQSGEVLKFYRKGGRSRAAKMALAMRMLILGPEFVGALVAIFVCFDPAGVFQFFDFYSARTVFNSRGAIVGTTDIVMIFYCTDVYNAFKVSKKNDKFVPFPVKHWYGLPLIVAIGLTAIIGDLTISQMSVRLELGGNVHLLPSLYLILLYFIGTIWLMYLSWKAGTAAEDVLASNKQAAADVQLKAAVDRTLLMRKYMMISAVGRIINLIGFVAAATGWYRSSPLAYATLFILLNNFPSLLSSTAQILIAIEITPSTRKGANKVAVKPLVVGPSKSKAKVDTMMSPSAAAAVESKTVAVADDVGAEETKGE